MSQLELTAWDQNNYVMSLGPSPRCCYECNYDVYIFWSGSRALTQIIPACAGAHRRENGLTPDVQTQLPAIALPNIGCITPRNLWLGWEGDKNTRENRSLLMRMGLVQADEWEVGELTC